jgi:N-acetylglucosamine-6-phosphate deacetylase
MTMTATVSARRALTGDGFVSDVALTIEDGWITAVGPTRRPEHEVLVAGFVDLQVNGHDDVDVATMSEQQWPRMRRLLLDQGVTTWCPTLVTADRDHYGERLEHLCRFAADDAPGPRLAGVHLEGPYLGALHGAHAGVPDGAIDLDWLASLPAIVRIVTLGPERDGAVDATRLLTSKGVLVALGHTAATYEQVLACVDAGARLFTHCFNATGRLHHRHPGATGAALATDELAISLIADGVHVHPAVLRLAARCKPPGRTVLVTDAVGWRAGRPGVLDRGRGLTVRDGAPRLPDGTLAGSNLTMDRAVRGAAADAGLGLEAALRAATIAPADLLGLEDRGILEVGRRADFLALDGAGHVVGTWVGGAQLASPQLATP